MSFAFDKFSKFFSVSFLLCLWPAFLCLSFYKFSAFLSASFWLYVYGTVYLNFFLYLSYLIDYLHFSLYLYFDLHIICISLSVILTLSWLSAFLSVSFLLCLIICISLSVILTLSWLSAFLSASFFLYYRGTHSPIWNVLTPVRDKSQPHITTQKPVSLFIIYVTFLFFPN